LAFSDLVRQLDPRPHVHGRQFERLCAWYLRNAPEYRPKLRKVWLWGEWPGAWAVEAGIDLVAETYDGELWAIQAKAYDSAYAIKKADVDSFLSESSRPEFSYRLLIATTDHLGPTARRTLDAQRVPVGYLLRAQLELEQVAWPESLDDLRPRRPARKKPRPHVREAIRATTKGFERTDRGQLLMACGTGKTLAGLWIAERLGSQRSLILVPSLSLLAQTLRAWSANAATPFDHLAVCSDETVAGQDEFVASTAELGLPVTTNPDEIAAFLRRQGRRVVFATYQSSPRIAAAYTGRTPQFDLAVADEAHRCAGRTSTDFATILDRDRIRARRRLFMTATPRLYTPRVRHEAGQLDVEVASMDDEAVFGPVLHRLTFGEGIERDLLSDYQVVVVGVDDETYRSYAERGEFVTRDGRRITDARTLAGQIGLAKTIRKYGLRRVISFHGRVKAAREFSADMPDVVGWMPSGERPAGPLWSEHVAGTMTSGHRDRLLLRFRNLAPGERGLLSNARCLGEGVDVPSINGVAFIDPRRSTIDIVQALGRAIRKSPDKKIGTIVLPVFFSGDEDPEQVLDESQFKHVWDVLKALRAHDELLGEELDELRRRLGARQSGPRRPGKIKLDVPAERVGGEFVRAFNARLVQRTTPAWEFYFGLLERYVEREGTAALPQAHKEKGYALGKWVSVSRHEFHRGTLHENRRKRLEALSGWEWGEPKSTWAESFAILRRFVKREGHARVPGGHAEGDFKLGAWVVRQRQAYKDGWLAPERVASLTALPDWTWGVLDAAWERKYEKLAQFARHQGHARPINLYREDGVDIGRWVRVQRDRYKRGVLEQEKAVRLAALTGWSWDVKDYDWEEGVQVLQQFVARVGDARVPSHHKEGEFPLGYWVGKVRKHYRERTLSKERRVFLESVSGWAWAPHDAAWEEGFERLEEFVREQGDARVPDHRQQHGYDLGKWVGKQRARQKKGTLDAGRRERLERLPRWTWDARTWEKDWEENLKRLRLFAERTGGERISPSYAEDGINLGTWVVKQRSDYARGKLPEENVRRLEAIPGWVWSPRDADWERAFALLRRFVEHVGHARVPAQHREDGYSLGGWVRVQRNRYATGKLSPERRDRLEALPDWVWEAGKTGDWLGAGPDRRRNRRGA